MTISDEIQKLQTNLTNSYSACKEKGATLPASQNFDNLSNTISSISFGDFYATVNITTNVGASVTFNGETKEAAVSPVSFNAYFSGTYLVSVEFEGEIKTSTINITKQETVNLNIGFGLVYCDYIYGDGSAYIPTDFVIPNAKCKFECKNNFQTNSSVYSIFGSGTYNGNLGTGNGYGYWFGKLWDASDRFLGLKIADAYFFNTNNSSTAMATAKNFNVYRLEKSLDSNWNDYAGTQLPFGAFLQNNEDYPLDIWGSSDCSNENITDYPIYFLAFNQSGTPKFKSKCSLSYCKFFDENDNLIANFVAAKNGDVLGLFNEVSGTFYEGAGGTLYEGTF